MSPRPSLRVVPTPDRETVKAAALQELLAALAVLERKVDAHDVAGWTENGRSSIQIGAVRPVMAALAAYRREATT